MPRLPITKLCPGLALSTILVFASASAAPSEPTLPAPIESEVWITLGADAFATIQGERLLDSPPPRLADNSGVVLSRVRQSDLPRISGRLHEVHRRCSGFMTHPSKAVGLEALAAATRQQPFGPSPYSIDEPAAVQGVASRLSGNSILATITSLSTLFNNRYHAHPSGVAAAQWIHDLWAGYAFGRGDVTVELVTHPGVNQPSVVLTIQGVTLPDEYIVLGAHLDSIASGSSNPNFSAPGADDDASGIASLSNVIQAAMLDGFRPARTVQFMGYAAEEVGLVGSQDIANSYQSAGVDVVAAFQLDMTAYNGSAPDIGLIGDFTDPTLTSFLEDLLDTYQPSAVWNHTACGYACSDHASWNNAGYPAAFAFESLVGQHNPTIHTTSDVTATFGDTGDHALKFARLAAAFMVETAKSGDVEIFSDGFESGSTDAWSLTVP